MPNTALSTDGMKTLDLGTEKHLHWTTQQKRMLDERTAHWAKWDSSAKCEMNTEMSICDFAKSFYITLITEQCSCLYSLTFTSFSALTCHPWSTNSSLDKYPWSTQGHILISMKHQLYTINIAWHKRCRATNNPSAKILKTMCGQVSHKGCAYKYKYQYE